MRALESALADFTVRGENISRLADRIRSQGAGQDLVTNMVGLVVGQRLAEADLAVAQVADSTQEGLVHVIA